MSIVKFKAESVGQAAVIGGLQFLIAAAVGYSVYSAAQHSLPMGLGLLACILILFRD